MMRRPNGTDIISRRSTTGAAAAGRPESSSARAAIASVNLPRRAAATPALLVAAANKVGWNGITVFGRSSRTWCISCKRHRPASALAVAVDDEDIAVRSVAVAEHAAQPHRIAHRAQCLIGNHDPEVGDVERSAIGRCGGARHIEDDVMELLAQRRHERVDRFGREAHIVAQRLFRAQHEKALADRGHHAFEQGVVDAHRVDEGLAQPGGRLDVEGQRAIAVLQVEIDERDPPVLPIGEMPGRG